MDIQESDSFLSVSIPYLKSDEKLELTVVAEGSFIPQKPDVAIRSPYDVKMVVDGSTRQLSLSSRFGLAGLVAAVAGFLVTSFLQGTLFDLSQKDILTFAASVSGLPKLAEDYATSSGDLTYFPQGDLAYALAAAAADRVEIDKYRRVLSITVEGSERMASASKANLYYSMGKIDLLLGEKDRAMRDFREAIHNSRSLVSEKSRQDPVAREFFLLNGIN